MRWRCCTTRAWRSRSTTAWSTRDENFKLEPALAESWQMVNPTTWRFKLRQGVKFHDGAPFTADDAVFSIERALGPTSQRSFALRGMTAVKKIDAQTIEFQLAAPDAVLPEKLQLVAMMSKAWCRAARRREGRRTSTASRRPTPCATPTAPGRSCSSATSPMCAPCSSATTPGGAGHDKRSGNLDDGQPHQHPSDATRLAALTSGEVDLVLDPPFQDVERLKTDAKLHVTHHRPTSARSTSPSTRRATSCCTAT